MSVDVSSIDERYNAILLCLKCYELVKVIFKWLCEYKWHVNEGSFRASFHTFSVGSVVSSPWAFLVPFSMVLASIQRGQKNLKRKQRSIHMY